MTNATHPCCDLHLHGQSMLLVPRDMPDVRVLWPIPVFGYCGMPDRASKVVFENVRVPASNMSPSRH